MCDSTRDFTKNSEINFETIKKSMEHRGIDFHGQVDYFSFNLTL